MNHKLTQALGAAATLALSGKSTPDGMGRATGAALHCRWQPGLATNTAQFVGDHTACPNGPQSGFRGIV